MLIRHATLDDARAIAEVHVASWRSAYKGILPDDVLAGLDVARREKQWRQWLEIPETRKILICTVNGGAAGFASYGRCRDDDTDPSVTGELYAIYLLEQFWSLGLGQALWIASLAGLRGLQSLRIKVWVLEENQRARRFYERVGFAFDGTAKEINLHGAVRPEVRYERLVEPAQPA